MKSVKDHLGPPSAVVGPGRRANADAVLDFLWQSDTVTVTDIMNVTQLTRATVLSICGDLLALGWVRELPARRESGMRTGRPARRFALAADAGCVLGVDIGEHSIKVALADLRGAVLARRSVEGLTPRTRAATRVRHVGRLAGAALGAAGLAPDQVLASGVGVAAPVDTRGRIGFRSQSHVDYDGGFRMNSEQLATVVGGGPVLVANDANVAALAERWQGHARGVDNVIALLASERLGAGVIDDGRLVLGRDGEAGEMYFLDHVDGVGAAHGVAMMARVWAVEAMQRGRRTVIGNDAAGFGGPVSAEMVFAAAAQGDALGLEIMDRLADRFAKVCGILATLLNPEMVVFCGGVAEPMRQLVEPMTDRVRALTYAPPRIACSTLGDAVVTTGAIRLALDHVQEHALDDTAQSDEPGVAQDTAS
jgi:predicted NBD/HSP70 family sugar kinase